MRFPYSPWGHISYDTLSDKEKRRLTYGYDGDGWKSGNYYTKYISNNPKFYTKDKYYGKPIYTPFWNEMKQTYQKYDCGVDCDYLGPRNLMMDMLVYIILASAFSLFFVAIMCGKDKYEQFTG